ncbi:unnamed protein product [Rotaria sp. Silwood1]|nr:unnamed protein product [Rotaria sp. Silwood1]
MGTSFRAVMSVRDSEALKRNFELFDSECSLDYGLSRHWFLILSREIFNPYYGIFEYSAIDHEEDNETSLLYKHELKLVGQHKQLTEQHKQEHIQ